MFLLKFEMKKEQIENKYIDDYDGCVILIAS
jgi:hypothetical protein